MYNHLVQRKQTLVHGMRASARGEKKFPLRAGTRPGLRAKGGKTSVFGRMAISVMLFFLEKGSEGMEERIGFIGIVIEDLNQTARVNQIISQYQEIVTGRIGVPDHERSMAVIGLLIRGDDIKVGALTGKLGNVPGVQVKSAMTKKENGGTNS